MDQVNFILKLFISSQHLLLDKCFNLKKTGLFLRIVVLFMSESGKYVNTSMRQIYLLLIMAIKKQTEKTKFIEIEENR